MAETERPLVRGVNIHSKEEKPGIDPTLIAATTIIGDKVIGSDKKELGKIEEIMMDITSGTLSYLVLSTGGILGIADKLFAVPLDSLTFDLEEKVFYLDVKKETLKKYPGFDKENWPRKAQWPITQ